MFIGLSLMAYGLIYKLDELIAVSQDTQATETQVVSENSDTTPFVPNLTAQPIYSPIEKVYSIQEGMVEDSIEDLLGENDISDSDVDSIEIAPDWEFGPTYTAKLDSGSEVLVKVLNNEIYSITTDTGEQIVHQNTVIDPISTPLVTGTIQILDKQVTLGTLGTRVEAPNSSIGIDVPTSYRAGFFVYPGADNSKEFFDSSVQLLNLMGISRGYFYSTEDALRADIASGIYDGGNRRDSESVVVITITPDPSLRDPSITLVDNSIMFGVQETSTETSTETSEGN